MIDFIRTWANQIIVAVIIATIFEMILPNGKNQKYIKMVIGIYVLFTVIQPIASKITGSEFKISTNYEKYFNKDILGVSTEEDFENNNSKLIEQAYIDNIKSDIQAKIEQKGYKIVGCNIGIIDEEKNYGAIENITLQISKQEDKVSISDKIEIHKVEIDINNQEVIAESNITDNQKQEIIEYIAEEYSIDEKQIVIN